MANQATGKPVPSPMACECWSCYNSAVRPSDPPERSAACACGSVEFDVKRCVPEEILTCPWCWAQYRYLGGGRMVPCGEPSSREAEHKPRRPGERAAEKRGPVAATHSPVPRGPGGSARPLDHPARGAARPSTRGAQAAPGPRVFKDPPGGFFPMILSIIAGNSLVFGLLPFLFVKNLDGSRTAPWGFLVAQGAFWPEILAVILGHVVAFFGWTVYVLCRERRRRAGGRKDSKSAETPGPPHA